jgi:hypothetical protein
MTFSKKLDRLMTVMGVLNSRLAKALNVDTSLISRFRTGARKPAPDSDYFKSIAQYFVTRSTMDYQKVALFELMQIRYDENLNNAEFLIDALTKWLSDDNSKREKAFDSFLNKISDYEVKLPFVSECVVTKDTIQNAQSFFGIEGKREAVIHFLTTILNNEKPCTMLLYSDESMEWLFEDETYRQKWAVLLMNVLMKGNKIRIIHTINRDLSEMLSAIESWLPLYITGSIEPYYYPKYNAGIFRKTMFIAENIIALTSQSMANKETHSANILYTDKQMLNSLTSEFNQYLKLCRPLMQILTKNKFADFLSLKAEFENREGNKIYKSNVLSLITMPEDLFCELFISKETEKFINNFREQKVGFSNNLESNTYTEIVTVPSKEDIKNNKIPVTLSEIFNGEVICYTNEQYRKHLENIILLLETYENYHFYFSIDRCNNNTLLAKDEVGAIIAKGNTPSVVFAFNHPNMTNAMYSYLENEESKINKISNGKMATINKLKELSLLLTKQVLMLNVFL